MTRRQSKESVEPVPVNLCTRQLFDYLSKNMQVTAEVWEEQPNYGCGGGLRVRVTISLRDPSTNEWVAVAES